MENSGERIELQIRKSAFNKRIHTFSLVNKEHIDIEDFMNDAFDLYHAEMTKILNEHNMVKSSTIFVAEFEKDVQSTDENGQPDGDVQKVKETAYFHTTNTLINPEVDLSKHYNENIMGEVAEGVENTAFRGSGFTLSRIIRLDVQICKYAPLEGSSYIQLPLQLQLKRAVVNVQNENDIMCFKWAILSAIYTKKYEKNPQRLDQYLKHGNELNFNGIDFPVHLNQIGKFEQQNEDISVHVYYYDDDDDEGVDKAQVLPIRISKNIKKYHIHLLLLMEDKKNKNVRNNIAQTTAAKIKSILHNDHDNGTRIRTHYCWIKNLSRLVSNQLNNHGHKIHICDRCLNFFREKHTLTEHSETCTNECHIKMPLPWERWITFKNLEYQLKAPFVIYADTEALLKRLDVDEQNQVFREGCSTVAYQEHHVYSVGYYFKCEFDDSKSFYASSINSNKVDCIEWFMEQLETLSRTVANMLLINKRMKPLTDEEQYEFYDSDTLCSICKLPFEPDEKRVRDHCHFSGKYRGPAHNDCNLKFKESRFIPVIMHNLSGYDAHLLIKKLSKKIDGSISVIPVNAEQYISITKTVDKSIIDYPKSKKNEKNKNKKKKVSAVHYYSAPEDDKKNGEKKKVCAEKIKLKFIDSYRFMPASLSHLSSLIPSEKKRILYAQCGKDYSPEQMAMLERKGVFPYDYVDSIERLSETALPAIEHFYSELNNEAISLEEYDHARRVWDMFQIKTLREYSELYLKTDVLLLADVFENFRETCHTIYKLDPAHYYTAPGLSFDAMLKHTNVNIELITDVDMLLFVERGVRGGISQCSQRNVKANNKYMEGDYKPGEKTNYLMYLDGKY